VRSLAAVGLALLLAGCAVSAQTRGERALARGDFAGAITEFQSALAEHPERVRALQGLGVAQYRSEALAEAAMTFAQVLERAPQNGTALLYSGLVALRRREDDLAADRLTQLRLLEPDPRFGTQVDRAFALLRAQPVSDETRAFVAASLEDAARAAVEIRAAQYEASRAWVLSAYPVRCYPTRRAGLLCL
jgi:tetratricopeptide (TPR) repeat protein